MATLVSYINAQNEEIVLDDLPRTFLGELYGRTGFEAPKLRYNETRYGSGATEILDIELEPREVTLFFWAPAETADLTEKLEYIKSRLIQIGHRNGNWGKLRCARRDGTYTDLNCVYVGGFDGAARESPTWIKFSLSFRADDPLFYDLSTTTLILRAYSEGDRLVFKSTTHFGASTHFRSSDATHEESISLDCFRVYPDITITGPATNIRLQNVTTGKIISLDSTFELLSGESLEIHTRPNDRSIYWIQQNGTKTKAQRYLTADTSLDWYMIAGENIIRYRNSTLSPISTCVLSYRKGFLSAN